MWSHLSVKLHMYLYGMVFSGYKSKIIVAIWILRAIMLEGQPIIYLLMVMIGNPSPDT